MASYLGPGIGAQAPPGLTGNKDTFTNSMPMKNSVQSETGESEEISKEIYLGRKFNHHKIIFVRIFLATINVHFFINLLICRIAIGDTFLYIGPPRNQSLLPYPGT